MKEKYLEIINEKIKIYKADTEKYSTEMLEDATDTKSFIDYLIASSVLEELLKFKKLALSK